MLAVGATWESGGTVTIGSSLFLIAVGAILKFAVTATVAGVDIQVVGLILMIVGGLGLIVGLALIISSRRPPAPPAPPMTPPPTNRPPAGY